MELPSDTREASNAGKAEEAGVMPRGGGGEGWQQGGIYEWTREASVGIRALEADLKSGQDFDSGARPRHLQVKALAFRVQSSSPI